MVVGSGSKGAHCGSGAEAPRKRGFGPGVEGIVYPATKTKNGGNRALDHVDYCLRCAAGAGERGRNEGKKLANRGISHVESGDRLVEAKGPGSSENRHVSAFIAT